MQINNMPTKNIAFGSGISRCDIDKYNKLQVAQIEKCMTDVFGIDTNLKDNKTFSILNFLCVKLLHKLKGSKQLSILDFACPPKQIRIFDRLELTKNFPAAFCTTVSKKILVSEPIFQPRSLFFENQHLTLEVMNEMIQDAKKQHFISSDNFLAFTMHEWMHNVHFDYLYRKFGFNEKEVLKYIKLLKNMEFSEREKAVIQEYLGDYVYNNGKINPTEVIAEGLNKLVCSCLDDNRVQINSDIDSVLQNMPKEFMQILKRILFFNS